MSTIMIRLDLQKADVDLQKADVEKLHNEVNQLRNQELLVNSFAIAMVAVALPAIKANVELSCLALVLLAFIGYWQDTLLVTRTRITAYLRVLDLSFWEKEYRLFSNRNKIPSMRKATACLFIFLGFIVLSSSCSLTYYTSFSLLLLLLFIVLFSFLLASFLYFIHRIFYYFFLKKGKEYIFFSFIFFLILLIIFNLYFGLFYYIFLSERIGYELTTSFFYFLYIHIVFYFGFKNEKMIISECEEEWKKIVTSTKSHKYVT